MPYSHPGGFSLSFHEGAEADLDELYRTDPHAAATIDAFLDEVAASQDLLDRFSQQGFTSGPAGTQFNVSRWQELWRRFNLWRAKLLNTPNRASAYRIVYAFHPRELRYYILAVVHRNFDYDPQHPVSRRIVDAYRQLDLP